MSELFIGRKKEIEWFHKHVFFASQGDSRCASLIGPNGIGKTALIRHLGELFEENPPPDTYYFPVNLPVMLAKESGDSDTVLYWRFFSNLILRISQDITEEKIVHAASRKGRADRAADQICSAYRFFDKLTDFENEKNRRDATLHLDSLFKYYTQLGFRLIITIDEFDIAREAFETGIFFQRLFSLSPKGTRDLNLSIVTVSRRDIGVIAHHMEGNSNIRDAYPPETLRGFSTEEMDEYFLLTMAKDGSLLEPREREGVVYFCGRHPGLLMRMRDEITRRMSPIDIAALHAERGAFIRATYDRMCELMLQEYADGKETVTCMSAFIQGFIGPAYSEQIKSYGEHLYEYGFVMMSKNNAQAVASGQEQDSVGSNGTGALSGYEPLSEYFVKYVRTIHLPNETASALKGLEQTERKVREVILRTYRQRFPDTWEQELERVVYHANRDKRRFLDALERTAEENDCAARGIEVTLLDVLSFKEYWKLIDACGEVFGSSFSGMEDAFNELSSYRNTGAHWNLIVLDFEHRKRLDGLCERVLSAAERVGINPQPQLSDNGEGGQQNAQQNPEPGSMVGSTVTLVRLRNKQGKLGGQIDGTGLYASISKNMLRSRNMTALELTTHDSIQVRLTRYDRNAGKYNAEPV